MADFNDLLSVMKKAATEAVSAECPAQVCFGKVTSISPLKILVDQKITLGGVQLVLSRAVTKHEVSVTVNWGTAAASTPSHSHPVVGTKTMTVNNALRVGDGVILLRQQGGQKYIVLDRIGGD